MKPFAKLVLFGVPIGILGLIALGGGFIHQSFTRYVPSAPLAPSAFHLAVFPAFTEGGTRSIESVIPFIYAFQREAASDPKVILTITPHSPIYGYEDKVSVTISSLTVTNEAGTTFPLIQPSSERSFDLHATGFGHRKEVIGAISGDRVSISAEGYAITSSGARLPFSQTTDWTIHRSSRTNLAITMSE
jgi:hypothetical protein